MAAFIFNKNNNNKRFYVFLRGEASKRSYVIISALLTPNVILVLHFRIAQAPADLSGFNTGKRKLSSVNGEKNQ